MSVYLDGRPMIQKVMVTVFYGEARQMESGDWLETPRTRQSLVESRRDAGNSATDNLGSVSSCVDNCINDIQYIDVTLFEIFLGSISFSVPPNIPSSQ